LRAVDSVAKVSQNMGLPGHRRTSSHKRRRASHFALKKIDLTTCPKCKKRVLPHNVCAFCGTYAGRQVLKVSAPAAVAKATKKPAAAKPAAKTAKKAVKAEKAERPSKGE